MPSSAIDGIRLMIDSPDVLLDPVYTGIDIAPGKSP